MIKLYQTVEDFVADESFQNFVLEKNAIDTQKWKSFIKENPSKKSIIDEARFFIQLLTPQHKSAPPAKKSYKKFFYWFALAVCITTLAFVFYQLSLPANVKEEPAVLHSAVNQNLSVVLPDESIVELRDGSSLIFIEDWSDQKIRKVKLKGEAFFDVKKDANQRPFEVEIENGVIEVLGTKFLARSEPQNHLVFLEEGKVSCHIDDRDFSIKPGDVLKVAGEKFTLEHNLDIRKYDSWRQKKLSFKNVSIEEVIQTINNSYDLNVSLGNSKLKERKITATVNENDPILLLEAIAGIYDIKIIKESNNLILK